MIGDAAARGPRKGTTAPGPEYKGKNSKGRSFKTVNSSQSDGGGDAEQKAVAKRSMRGMRPGGTGMGSGTKQEPKPYAAKSGSSYKTVAPRKQQNDSGNAIEAWCSGKRGSYK